MRAPGQYALQGPGRDIATAIGLDNPKLRVGLKQRPNQPERKLQGLSFGHERWEEHGLEAFPPAHGNRRSMFPLILRYFCL